MYEKKIIFEKKLFRVKMKYLRKEMEKNSFLLIFRKKK